MRRFKAQQFAAVLVLIPLVVVGCGARRSGSAHRIAFGGYGGDAMQLFGALGQAMQRAGYAPIEADEANGTLTASALTAMRGYEPQAHRIQARLFADGWVEVRPLGPLVTSTSSTHLQLPAGLEQECRRLVMQITSEIGIPGEAGQDLARSLRGMTRTQLTGPLIGAPPSWQSLRPVLDSPGYPISGI
jgi:hypothetical protein